MRRRTYLLATAAAALAGCMSSSDEEPNEEPEEENTNEPEAEVVRPGTFDSFDDLSAWNVTYGSISADEQRSYVGDQSAFLEIGAARGSSDPQVNVSRTFDTPKDLTEVVPGLALTAERMVNPVIRVYDSAGDRIDFRRGVTGGLPFMRYNYGVSQVDGNPDMSDVREIELIFWDESGERDFWVDDLHMVPRPDTGKVMLQFDDGHDTDYTRGLPLLEEYGYEAASFINPGRVGNRDRLDAEQVDALHEAGWTIGNHSHTHPYLSELEPAHQEIEIRNGKQWLEDHGYDEGARYFAYPFGDYDAVTVDLVEKYHDLGFAGGQPVQGYNANPLMCTRIGDPSAERARTMLDRTAEMRGITCLFYHRLEGQRYEDFETTLEHLHELESAGEIDLILPSDLEDDLQL
ncbi:polysaccharide deacetylase family protein [Natronobiforma cellulositropha]|uniref:polysaccharide deacetylase family protein n=1 Tax=Natronobiforma cellulositropha TaxID=1679076 RepID=UPI0021D5BDAA|nr:polysaccharide deacetylase family protein [Natronobiforma cellulositropha]